MEQVHLSDIAAVIQLHQRLRQRGSVASEDAVLVDPSVPASMPRDADDR